MKNLITIIAILVTSLFMMSCQSKSSKKHEAKMKKELAEASMSPTSINLDTTLAEKTMLEVQFERAFETITSFTNKHANCSGDYAFISETNVQNGFNQIEIDRVGDYYICIEKRQVDIRKDLVHYLSNDVIGYSVSRKKVEGQFVYTLKTTHFIDSKELKAKTKTVICSDVDQLEAALSPFYERLYEAERLLKKAKINMISEIEDMHQNS